MIKTKPNKQKQASRQKRKENKIKNERTNKELKSENNKY